MAEGLTCSIDPAADQCGDVIGLLGGCDESLGRWWRPVERGAVADDVLDVAIEIVDGDSAQDALGVGEDALARAVVDLQAAGASAGLDPKAAEAHLVVVDPLMRIAGQEEIVRSWRDACAQQPPLGRMEVLCLVDYGVGVQAGVGCASGELLGREVGELHVRRALAGGEVGDEALDRRPDLLALTPREADAAARPWRHRVLGQGVDVPGEHDLLPFGDQEAMVEVEFVEPAHHDGVAREFVQLVGLHGAQAVSRGREHLLRERVNRAHMQSAVLLRSAERPQRPVEVRGQAACVGRDQEPLGAVTGRDELLGEEARAVHEHDGLASPCTSGDLDGAVVHGAFGEHTLGGMQERPPCLEVAGQQIEQLAVVGRDGEGRLAGGTVERRVDVARCRPARRHRRRSRPGSCPRLPRR